MKDPKTHQIQDRAADGTVQTDLTLQERERVAGELRHWVRLTRRCNNRCIFCLDSVSQDGSVLSIEDLQRDLEAGRERGALRVVLSGGEPTIHPRFVETVSLARSLGYQWIQVVTNGRMFAYRSFLDDCLAAGLSEATFSMPAAHPRMYAMLTGTPRAFDQALAGLRRTLSSRRLVVSVDIVVSKVNLAALPEIVAFYLDLGVREFDLLQVVPFGRAFEFRDRLLFESNQKASALVHRAIDLARQRGAVVWTNRMDPRLLEGFEEYIQDPRKIADEVRGRRAHLDAFVAGEAMPCQREERCAHCFLQGFCNHLRLVRDALVPKLSQGVHSTRQTIWLRCEPESLERAAALLAASRGATRRRIAGLWLSVDLDQPAQNRHGVASRLAAVGADSWILSLSASRQLRSATAPMSTPGAPAPRSSAAPSSSSPGPSSSSPGPSSFGASPSSATAPMSLPGASHVPSDASPDPRPEALSALLRTFLESGIACNLRALRLDFDLSLQEAGLVVDWYHQVMDRPLAEGRGSRPPADFKRQIGPASSSDPCRAGSVLSAQDELPSQQDMSPSAQDRQPFKEGRSLSQEGSTSCDGESAPSREDREPVVLVLTVGLVSVPVVAWMAARLPAGAVRLALPEVGSVADLDGLEALGLGPLSWIADWRHRIGEGETGDKATGDHGTGDRAPGAGGSAGGESAGRRRLDGSISVESQDVPPCLLGGAPAAEGPLWLSVGSLDDQGRLLPDRFVEDYVRQAYRVWSARCDDCPARGDCAGLPIQVARRYGLSILDPSAMRDVVGSGDFFK